MTVTGGGLLNPFSNGCLIRNWPREYLSKYDKEYEEARKKLEKSGAERREGAIAIRITKTLQGDQ